MTNPTALGARIVCFTDTTICDGPGQHDIQLWTDGHVAYATVAFLEDACPLISRDLTQIEVTCGYVRDDETGETCGHHARFALDDECWTTDLRAVDMLNKHGEVIEA
jgi:hypothetical protein